MLGLPLLRMQPRRRSGKRPIALSAVLPRHPVPDWTSSSSEPHTIKTGFRPLVGIPNVAGEHFGRLVARVALDAIGRHVACRCRSSVLTLLCLVFCRGNSERTPWQLGVSLPICNAVMRRRRGGLDGNVSPSKGAVRVCPVDTLRQLFRAIDYVS